MFGRFKLKKVVLTVFFLHVSTSFPDTFPSPKAPMRQSMRFKPRHSALRSNSLPLAWFMNVIKDAFFVS